MSDLFGRVMKFAHGLKLQHGNRHFGSSLQTDVLGSEAA